MSEINNKEEHTMKKRFLSLLMAFCLMLSLAPAAFAADNQPDTVTLPSGENVEIPNVSSIQFPDDGNLTAEVSASDVSVCSVDAESELGYEGSGTAADPYKVYSGKGLVNLSSKFQSSNMTFSRIYLMNDIDLSKETITNTYLFRYFAGVIQSSPELIQAGKRAVIKGMGIRSLVYGFFMGTLGYFDVDMGGVPSQLTLIPGTVSGQYLETSVQNVDIYSGSKEGAGKLPVSLENGDAQANYSPYVFATGGTFTMKNCTNYADITGTTYGSVFYGYYPLGEAPITFTNCVNKGTFTMRHAAMFFGNNTLFSGSDTYFAFHKDDPTQNKIQFVNCKNEGFILGTTSANLFATRAAGDNDALSEDYETYLRSSGCMEQDSVQVIGKELDMKLYSDADGNLTMTPATDKDVAYYVVSVYSYVNAFKNTDDTWIGTDRFGTQEKLENGSTQISLKKYGVCDYEEGTPGMTTEPSKICGLTVVKYDGTPYYWLNVMDSHGDFYWTISKTGDPAIKTAPDIVTLSAYKSNGTLLGTVSDIAAPLVTE